MIVDLVETGETLKSANLKIQESLLESEALLIMNPNTKHHKLAEQVSLRIAGISKANSYALIEYNIQRKNLVRGEKLTHVGNISYNYAIRKLRLGCCEIFNQKRKRSRTYGKTGIYRS